YNSVIDQDNGFQGDIEDLGARSDYASPGWRRLKENASQPVSSPILEGKAVLLAAETGHSGFKLGQRVFHQKFGYGKVVDANGTKLSVAFEKAGIKKVISTFIKPV
ncbi:MAG: DNA helicase II, partial [Henriciella sp.]